MNTWGFERKKVVDKKRSLILIWKASFLFILFSFVFSFFSVVNEVVYAWKVSVLEKLSKLSSLSFVQKNSIPVQIAWLILDYKKWKNILLDKYEPSFIFAENHLNIIISILWYWQVKNQVSKIYNQLKPYKKDIFKLLWKYNTKNYLIILENTSEERPDWGFFGSFIELSISWWHITHFSVVDSYKVIFDQCWLTGKNWYKDCDRSKLHIQHNLTNYNSLFKYTSFLNSNYFGFTDLNAKNIILHYKKAYWKDIDGVIFIKSDILKYLIVDGEKLIWKMEIMNYKNLMRKKKWLLNKWIKDEYLSFVKKTILQNKKNIVIQFIKNYDTIRKLWLIRVYFKWITNDFKSFLKYNNFNYYNDKKSAYFFFYNVWNNKSSKFVDHIVTIDDKVYINPKSIPLNKGLNIISYKNIFNENNDYYDLLTKEQIDKESFLWWKDTKNYDTLLIVPKNCTKYKSWKNKYIVECD